MCFFMVGLQIVERYSLLVSCDCYTMVKSSEPEIMGFLPRCLVRLPKFIYIVG